MPRRPIHQRPEGEDSSLALDTRSRAVIQQLVDEKRAALEAAAPHIPLEEYLHGGQDSLQSSIKRMRDAAASFASAGELVAPAAPAAPAADDTARAHHSTDVAGSGTLGPGSATRRPASAPHSRTGAMGQRGAAGGTGEAPSLQRPSGHARARAERLQEEVRLREETECTFHPRTNLAVPTVRVADPNAFFERSAKWREERERRIEAQKRRAEARKLQECTFKPHTARRGRGTPAAGGRAAPQVAKASFAASSPGSGAAAPAVASMAAASERLYSEAQARLVQRQLASQQRGAPLAPSPPAAAAVTECVRNPRNAELRRAAADDADCPFAPQTNGPKRSTSAATLGVTSRYRKQSPARPARALPSGEEHCTFTPRVNRVPRRLSEAAAGYLGDGAFDRLSRVPPPPPDAASASGVDRRSASAPGERPEPPGKATAAAGTDDDAKSRWTAFLGRQQRYAAQKREGEQARLMRAKSEAGQQPELSQGTRKLSELSAGVENRPSFLQRDSERRRARSWGGSQLGVSASSRGFAEAEVPTHEATDCTFAPQINGDARARRPRTVDELSAGDAQRRSQAHAVLKQRAETQATESLTFKPEINAVSGVQSRLKVSSEPESYLARVRQHMALKEKVTACVREAEEALELQECTFHPQTHEAPAYVTRIAKSMQLAKAARPEPERVQEWK